MGLFILAGNAIQAQYLLESEELLADASGWYDGQIGLDQSGLLNGQYVEIKRISRGTHQFFVSDEWHIGQLTYRGQHYDSVYMSYDIDQDLLLIRHPTSYIYHNQAIKPIQSQVSAFNLRGSHFEYFDEQIDKFRSGFFEVIASGENIKVIAKRHKKTLVERTIVFEQDDSYYFQLDGSYHPIKRKGSVLRVFSDQKAEIRSFIKDQDLQIAPGNDSDIVELMAFIDQKLLTQ